MTISIAVWKYVFLTTNILISLLDVLLIQYGVVALGGVGSIIGAYTASAIGCLVFALCFLGCFASLRESNLLAIAFVILSTFTIIIEFAFMIAFVVMRETFLLMAGERIDNQWTKEQQEQGAMDAIQIQYNCCGRESPQDYLQDDQDVLPNSCCLNNDCSINSNIRGKGCALTLVNFFDDQSDHLILTIVALIAIELLGVVSSYYMAKGIRIRNQKVKTAANVE